MIRVNTKKIMNRYGAPNIIAIILTIAAINTNIIGWSKLYLLSCLQNRLTIKYNNAKYPNTP